MRIGPRVILTSVAAVGALVLGAGLAGTALAGPASPAGLASPGSGSVTVVTHASHHPDTCACTTGVPSDNGYVWAYDNLARQFTVTDHGDGTYTVVVTDDGSFAAFAEPNNHDLSGIYPITAHGSVQGTYSLEVQATKPPLAAALPSQESADVSTGGMIEQLFQHSTTGIVGGDYTYTYRAGGEIYTQSVSGITGDITG